MPYVLSAAAVLAAVALYLFRCRSPYRRKSQVAVHTKDGNSIVGVLEAVYPSALVLKGPKLQLSSEPQPSEEELSGDVLVERANVSFVQRLP